MKFVHVVVVAVPLEFGRRVVMVIHVKFNHRVVVAVSTLGVVVALPADSIRPLRQMALILVCGSNLENIDGHRT